VYAMNYEIFLTLALVTLLIVVTVAFWVGKQIIHKKKSDK